MVLGVLFGKFNVNMDRQRMILETINQVYTSTLTHPASVGLGSLNVIVICCYCKRESTCPCLNEETSEILQ